MSDGCAVVAVLSAFVQVDFTAGVMSIMFLYYSEERSVKGKEVAAHTMDTNLISTGEFLMKFPSVQQHVVPTCHDEFFKVINPSHLSDVLVRLSDWLVTCTTS